MTTHQNEYENLVEDRAHDVVSGGFESNYRQRVLSASLLFVRQLLISVKHSPHLKLIALRLPSLVLADVLLHNSSIVYDYFFPTADSPLQMTLLSFLITYTISRCVMLFALLTCFLLFTLSVQYVINIYKVMLLFAMPFLFTYLMNACYSFSSDWLPEQLVVLVLVCLSYAFIVSVTILLYNDIYRTIIFDKYNMRQLNSLNADVTASNMQRLADYQYEKMFSNRRGNENTTTTNNNNNNTADNNNNNNEEDPTRIREYTQEEFYSGYTLKWFFINSRRIYILAYSVLSLVLNEFTVLLVTSSSGGDDDSQQLVWPIENPDKPPYNIMSLGYLTLLTFDLSVNLDQMLARLFVKIKVLNRLVSTYGVNHFITWNWYERLRVPFVLRVYFLVRVYLFTMSFLFYTEFYRRFYSRLVTLPSQDQNSLFAVIRSFYWFLGSSESSDTDNNTAAAAATVATSQTVMISNDDYHATSIMGHFVSLFPFVQTPYNQLSSSSSVAVDLDENVLSLYFKMVILNVSTNLVPISAITSILSWQFYLLGDLVRRLLNSKSENNVNNQNRMNAPPRANNNNNNDMAGGVGGGQENDLRNVGDVAALLFVLLSIQSGLTSLLPKSRIQKFTRNYSLLFIAMLHYFHTTLDQQLRTLSASSKTRREWWYRDEKRLRAIGLSILLILLPACIMTYSLRECELSTWLLASTAFNLELIVKVTVSLVLYSLFTLESNRINQIQEQMMSERKKTDGNENENLLDYNDSAFSNNLDDYVYYVKVFGHVFEFVVAIFLFFNGAYILLFESCGLIRALLMGIHVYFHIFCKAEKGWKSFKRRRTAIGKLKQLDEFNKENYINYIKTLHDKRSAAATSSTTTNISDENNNPEENKKQVVEDDNNNNNKLLEEEYETKRRDVCAICFSELSSQEARITRCGHIYHFACLRKWLYLQDTCPMCHQQIYAPPK